MADVFISYAREDRDTARTVAKALEADAYSVWWDRQLLGGENFDEVIERELDLAKSVIVLWSSHAVSSDWVRSEAAAAAERGILVPAYIDTVKLPLQFRRKHTVDLTAWRGDAGDPEFEPMRQAVAAHLHRESPLPTPRRRTGYRISRRFSLIAAVCVAVGLAALMAVYLTRKASTERDDDLRGDEGQEAQATRRGNDRAVEQEGRDAGDEPAAVQSPPEPKLTGRYSVSRCGAIKDANSGLEWYVGPDRTVTWYEAQDWSKSLQACAGGWRMPTIKELNTLYDPSQTAGTGYLAGGKRWPAHIDPIFEIGEGAWAWAAGAPTNGEAKSFNFNQGVEAVYSPTNTDYTTHAFAVRGVE